MIGSDRLRKVRLFADLSDEEVAWLGDRMGERSIPSGGRATEEGAAGYAFFAIEDGEAQVLHGETEIRQLAAGDTVGEAAIIGDGRRTADVVATTDLELFVMFGTRFRELQMGMPDLAATIEASARSHQA